LAYPPYQWKYNIQERTGISKIPGMAPFLWIDTVLQFAQSMTWRRSPSSGETRHQLIKLASN
jgi:hypothetical protein